jgi:hypothetical protein
VPWVARSVCIGFIVPAQPLKAAIPIIPDKIAVEKALIV